MEYYAAIKKMGKVSLCWYRFPRHVVREKLPSSKDYSMLLSCKKVREIRIYTCIYSSVQKKKKKHGKDNLMGLVTHKE